MGQKLAKTIERRGFQKKRWAKKDGCVKRRRETHLEGGVMKSWRKGKGQRRDKGSRTDRDRGEVIGREAKIKQCGEDVCGKLQGPKEGTEHKMRAMIPGQISQND